MSGESWILVRAESNELCSGVEIRIAQVSSSHQSGRGKRENEARNITLQQLRSKIQIIPIGWLEIQAWELHTAVYSLRHELIISTMEFVKLSSILL